MQYINVCFLARHAHMVYTNVGCMPAYTPSWQSDPVSQHHRLATQLLLLRTMHRMLFVSEMAEQSGAYMMLKMILLFLCSSYIS